MASGWYYVANGTRIGPVERAEIERLIGLGSVAAQTLVWRAGMAGWEEAGHHFVFAGPVGGPPPMPVREPAPALPAGVSYGATAAAAATPTYAGAPARGFGEAISVCFGKYASFAGRASRSEFWYFNLFLVLVGLVAGFLDTALFGLKNDFSPINALASLVMFLPQLAVTVRRLHDTDRSGWWVGGFWLALIAVALLVGVLAVLGAPRGANEELDLLFAAGGVGVALYAIAMLVFMCLRGTPGRNRFDR